MPFATPLCDRLNLGCPIVQAPLAGGGDTPELAAAVSNAGGLGFIGGAYSSPEQILALASRTKSLTDRSFGINLFAPVTVPAAVDGSAAVAKLTGYFEEMGLEAPRPPNPAPGNFEAQFEAVLASGARCFSFTFGRIPQALLQRARDAGIVVMGTATTAEEAMHLEADGVDFIVAQGSEAGGHRGSFTGSFEEGLVGTISLVPRIADSVRIPVLASGGIMDGRGIAAALCLGAAGVQMGTAFLACLESGISQAYRAELLRARENHTRVTRAFSGRPARGIVNRFMREVDEEPNSILPFPLQNSLTRPLRTAAAAQNRSEFLSLWAGQGLGMVRPMKASDLVTALGAETIHVLEQLNLRTGGAGGSPNRRTDGVSAHE